VMFAKGLRRARSATVGMWLAYAREVRARVHIGVEDIEDAVLGTFCLLSDRPVVRTLAQIATKHANSNELAHMKVRALLGHPSLWQQQKR